MGLKLQRCLSEEYYHNSERSNSGWEINFDYAWQKKAVLEWKKFHIDEFDKRVVNEFYGVQKKVPTLPELLFA